MVVGPQDFISILQVFHHALPFGFAMILNYSCFFIFPLQIHLHTNGICFGMKLSSNKPLIKTYGHHSSLVGYMGAIFFNCQNGSTQGTDTRIVWFNHLIIATVYSLKRISQSSKYRLL